ncbi:amidohydrolase family protein [bacterium]|nr:amidohydrolase family protein [bacterium]
MPTMTTENRNYNMGNNQKNGIDDSSNFFVRNYTAPSDAKVSLKNGRIVDVLNGCYYAAGVNLVLQNGRILSMPGLPGQEKGIDPDFTIDLEGKAVIPGLFNTHVHIQIINPSLLISVKDLKLIKKFKVRQIEKNMADCLLRGVTNIRDAITENLVFNRNLKDRILRKELRGPRIYQAVNISPLGGTFAPSQGPIGRPIYTWAGFPPVHYEKHESGVLALNEDATTQEVRDAVDRAIDERGADYIKIYDQREKKITFRPGAKILTQEQLETLVNQARKRGVKTTIHQITVESFRRAVKAGVDSLAHLPRDGLLTIEDIEAFMDSNCMIEPTVSLSYSYSWNFKGCAAYGNPRIERIEEYRDSIYPFNKLAKDYWIPELRPSVIKGMERSKQEKTKMFRTIDMKFVYRYLSSFITNGVDNLKQLSLMGAMDRMACGNDAGATNFAPASVKQEIELRSFLLDEEPGKVVVSGGDALRMATLNSARALGLENDFGTIEPGKVADLAILDGDPLQDPGLIGSPVDALFMDGKLVVNKCGLEIKKHRI